MPALLPHSARVWEGTQTVPQRGAACAQSAEVVRAVLRVAEGHAQPSRVEALPALRRAVTVRAVRQPVPLSGAAGRVRLECASQRLSAAWRACPASRIRFCDRLTEARLAALPRRSA